jgi:hypothetical protein
VRVVYFDDIFAVCGSDAARRHERKFIKLSEEMVLTVPLANDGAETQIW